MVTSPRRKSGKVKQADTLQIKKIGKSLFAYTSR